MNIHYTGRQVEVDPSINKQVEMRIQKLKKILGPRPALETHVILSQMRGRYNVEVTVNLRNHSLVGSGGGPDLKPSMRDALDKLEKQALKHKARLRVSKRHAHPAASRSIRTLAVA